MTLNEYINSEDSHVFWRLSDGERQNLLEEAIERIVELHGIAEAALVSLNNAALVCDEDVKLKELLDDYFIRQQGCLRIDINNG